MSWTGVAYPGFLLAHMMMAVKDSLIKEATGNYPGSHCHGRLETAHYSKMALVLSGLPETFMVYRTLRQDTFLLQRVLATV